MLQFTTEQIQKRFDGLPKDLQEAVSSADVRDSVEEIGKKYGLHIDQLGEMVDLVGLIMLGLSPAKDFVKNFSRESGVKEDISSAIATDINTEVLGKIRSSMQAFESKEQASEMATVSPDQARFNQAQADQAKLSRDISSVEKAGGFSIEREGNPHVDPIMDHLLSNPTSSTEKKIVHHTAEPPANLPEESVSAPTPPLQPKRTPAPAKKYDSDPYHEPIK